MFNWPFLLDLVASCREGRCVELMHVNTDMESLLSKDQYSVFTCIKTESYEGENGRDSSTIIMVREQPYMDEYLFEIYTSGADHSWT